MSKTPEELAEEYTKDWWGNLPEAEGMRKSARENFLAGYKAASNQQFKDNYNDHKWKEAQDTIVKLKERLKLLSLEFSYIMETTEEVRDLFEGWKKDDQIFEHHSKVGPWAGFFPVNKGKK